MRIAVVVALACWLLKIISAKRRTLNVELRTLDIAILAFLAVAWVSTLFISPYKHQSLDWFTNLATYTSVYFILVNNIESESQVKRLIGAMLIAATILGIYGIFQYFNILDILPHSQDSRISSTYYHPSHYAGFLAIVTPLAAGYFLFSKSLWKTVAFGTLCVLLVANLALSFSITNLAFVISMFFLILIVIYLREYKIIVKRLLPGLVGLFCLYFFMLIVSSFMLRYSISAKLQELTNFFQFGINTRTNIWESGLPVFLNDLYAGWGLGLFSDVFSKFRPPTRTNFLNYAHSDYLQIASDMGIIGLGIYLVLIGTIVKKSIFVLKHKVGERNQSILVGLVTALFAAIVRSFIDSNLFVVQSLSVYLFALIGILARSTQKT